MSQPFPLLTPQAATAAKATLRKWQMPSLPWLEILPFISLFLFAYFR